MVKPADGVASKSLRFSCQAKCWWTENISNTIHIAAVKNDKQEKFSQLSTIEAQLVLHKSALLHLPVAYRLGWYRAWSYYVFANVDLSLVKFSYWAIYRLTAPQTVCFGKGTTIRIPFSNTATGWPNQAEFKPAMPVSSSIGSRTRLCER